MSIGSTPSRYRIRIDRDAACAASGASKTARTGSFAEKAKASTSTRESAPPATAASRFCPRDAIDLTERPVDYRSHPLWTREAREAIYNRRRPARSCLAGMGNAKPYP